MSTGKTRWLAWMPLAAYFGLVTSGLSLQAMTGTSFGDMGVPIPALALFYGIMGLMVIIGTLLILRHPRHPVGWLLSVGFVTPAIDQLATGYVAYGLAPGRAPLPGANAGMIWLNISGMPVGMFLFVLVFLLSPDGKFISKGWARVAWIALAGLAGYLLAKIFEPGPLVLMPGLNNPFGAEPGVWAIAGPLMWIALAALFLCLVAAPLSLLARVRHGPPEVRRQVAWLIPFGALFAAGVPLNLLGEHGANRALFSVGGVLHMVAVSGLTLVVAFAVFKYRLYDLDIVIRRTLVYSLLTGALGLAYFASVAVLQQIFPAGSQLTTVLSTLAIAALFSPLRRRIQQVIDERFFRRKYDAARILARFRSEMRDEVDVKRLALALEQAVDEALHPSALALWLRRRDE